MSEGKEAPSYGAAVWAPLFAERLKVQKPWQSKTIGSFSKESDVDVKSLVAPMREFVLDFSAANRARLDAAFNFYAQDGAVTITQFTRLVREFLFHQKLAAYQQLPAAVSAVLSKMVSLVPEPEANSVARFESDRLSIHVDRCMDELHGVLADLIANHVTVAQTMFSSIEAKDGNGRISLVDFSLKFIDAYQKVLDMSSYVSATQFEMSSAILKMKLSVPSAKLIAIGQAAMAGSAAAFGFLRASGANSLDEEVGKIVRQLDNNTRVFALKADEGVLPNNWGNTFKGTGVRFEGTTIHMDGSTDGFAMAEKGFTKGRHYFEFETKVGGDTYLGLVNAQPPNGPNSYHGQGYGWAVKGSSGRSGTQAYIRGSNNGPAVQTPGNGDRSGFLVDMKARTCTYFLNGQSGGVIFTDLPDIVYPSISNHTSPTCCYIAHFGLPLPRV